MSVSKGVKIERLTDQFGLLEGPHWEPKNQILYFNDIFGQKIFSLDTKSGKIFSAHIKHGPVGFAVPVEGTTNKFVAGVYRDVILITWDGESDNSDVTFEILTSVDGDRDDTRINDGKIDSTGRMWMGTMAIEVNGLKPDRGQFYSLGGDLKAKCHVTPVSISNGIDWSLNDDIMYYIDSLTYQVVAFDFDAKRGTIANKRVIFDLKENKVEGIPDGMTIDTDGNLWVAVYMGSYVLQIDPESRILLRKIEMPASNVTSVCFGGPLLDILYVTTSSYGFTDEQKKEQPGAGCLFAVKGLGVKGRLPNNFKLQK